MHKLTSFLVACALLMLTSLVEADILPGKPTVLITGSNRGTRFRICETIHGAWLECHCNCSKT